MIGGTRNEAGGGGVSNSGTARDITTNIGLTFAEHKQDVEERLAEREAQLKESHGKDCALLEQQVAEARRRLENIESDYERTKADLAEALEKLNRYSNQFEPGKVDAAREALSRGERELADALFAQIQASAQPTIEAAAEAAFERGKLAEDDIRWHDADRHYGEAERLSPTFDHLIKAGEFADKCGDYRRGARIKEQLVELAEVEYGPEDARTTTALNNLAGSYYAQARYAEAEPLYRRAIEIDEKTRGSDHPGVAISLNNLAALLEDTGRFDEAEPLYRRAIEIGEKTLGSDHPEVAIRLNNLANLLGETGRFDEAEPLYRRAIEIGEKTLGSNHPEVAVWLNNLANLLRETGRFEEAEPLYRRALEIGEKTLGSDHPNVAIRLNNLASLLNETRRFDDAEPLYKRALEIFRKALGEEHPSTQTVIANYEGFKALRNDR